MKDSKIAWTHHTFNPWIGCTKVSAGCQHCYAETLNHRWGKKNWGPAATRQRTSSDYWKQPAKWNAEAAAAGERRRVFCASMADVGEDRPDLVEARRDLSVIIENTPWLDWLLLTKRPENLKRLFARWMYAPSWPHNVWAGTSVENQKEVDSRIPHLREVPARIRFLSCEPLLEPITFRPSARNLNDMVNLSLSGDGALPLLLDGIHWVIVGGESGPGARPMEFPWASIILNDCRSVDTKFFMKQMGGVRDKKEKFEDLHPLLAIREFPE